VSSRLAVDQHGRKVAIVTAPSMWLEVGDRFLIVDALELGFEPRGRRPTARERMEAKPPYESKTKAATWERRAAVLSDDELDDKQAIAYARREQQREPADLIGRAA
jgi:hypothetical protein